MGTYSIDLVDSEPRLHQLWQRDQVEYDGNTLSFQAFKLWWAKYDLGLRIVTNKDCRIVGAVGIWGLSEETIRYLISGQVSETSIVPMSTDEMTRNPTQYWYFSGIFSDQKLQKTLGTPLRRLLYVGIGAWAASPHIKFPCHCYALGYSDDGKALLDRLGFEIIKQGCELPDGMPLYWRQFNNIAEFRQVAHR